MSGFFDISLLKNFVALNTLMPDIAAACIHVRPQFVPTRVYRLIQFKSHPQKNP